VERKPIVKKRKKKEGETIESRSVIRSGRGITWKTGGESEEKEGSAENHHFLEMGSRIWEQDHSEREKPPQGGKKKETRATSQEG